MALPGSLWVESDTNELRFVTSSGAVWAYLGAVIGTPAGAIVGSIWIDTNNTPNTLDYIDRAGVHRRIGTDVTEGTVAVTQGSTWLDPSSNPVPVIVYIASNNDARLAHSDRGHIDNAHIDTPAVNTGPTNSHTDTAHTDTPHDDEPPQDSHNDNGFAGDSHVDIHTDTVHVDTPFNDVAHTDTHDDTAHDDEAFTDIPHDDELHGDQPYLIG